MTSNQKQIMLSALTPSNRITIGNYIGAIKNWEKMSRDYDCLFFVVDLHALTERRDPTHQQELSRRALASYIACGLDPKNVTIFFQSHVSAHAELSWILTCHSYMGELSRMTQFKDKSQKHGESIPAGLFSYPVLMAADILLYQTDLVPVGIDQKQHIELARDLAIRMNGLYNPNRASKSKLEAALKKAGDTKSDPQTVRIEGDLFKLPDAWIPQVGAKIMSLQDPTKKMSKSDPDPKAAVYIDDSDKEIEKKVKSAVTDSGSEIKGTPDQPGVVNLLTIQQAITGKSLDALVASYAGKMYGHLKVDTAEMLVEKIRPIREETERLVKEGTYLNQVMKDGADRARARADATLNRVKDALGLIR